MSDDDNEDNASRQEVAVGEDQAGLRLDKALALLCPAFSRSRLKVLIESGDVTVDGRVSNDASGTVLAGQSLSFTVPAPVQADPEPQDIPLDVVYEDAHMLVVNKQAGLVVHPGAGNWSGTLVNALLYHCGDTLSGIGGVARPGIVHRLDKDTSGLMVVAKSDTAHRGLASQLEARSLSRTYTAMVWKIPTAKGLIDKPIMRASGNRMKMSVALGGGGREARTQYRRIATFHEAAAQMQCDLETGRTHQIRVHMQAIGHPLVGDPLYGLQATAGGSLLKKGGYGPEAAAFILGFPRQALHAAEIRFIHPVSGDEMGFASPLPDDLQRLISYLNQ